MSRSLLSLVALAILALSGSAQAVSVFTQNGCPTVLAAAKPVQTMYGPRAAPVAGVDYSY